MKYLLFPFRLVAALVGYNLCFFECHHWVDGGRDYYDERRWRWRHETYKVCSRCRTIKLSTWRRDDETA